MRRIRHSLPLLTLLLIAAFASRLYAIQADSIWFDEGWSAYAAAQPTLQGAINADATNPPLYYLLLNLAARFFGDSAFSLRLVSAFFGLLVIPLAYQLGRRLFGVRAGMFAAFLAAFSPLLWWASQEARMYTLLAFCAAAAALAWHQLLRRSSRWAWLVLWGAELALLYAHNTGPVAALWLNVVTLLAWLVRRSARRPDWRLWIAGQVAVGLLWSPYFITRFLTLTEANSAVSSAPQLSLDLLGSIWSAFWAGNWSMVGREPQLAILTPSLPFIGLSGIALLFVLLTIPWREVRARWLVAHVVILTAALLLGLIVLGNELHGRYLVMIAPLLVIPIGAGLARMRFEGRLLGTVFFAIIFAVVLLRSHAPEYAHDDARGMVQHYADTLTADDTVLAWSYADRYELAYYWPRLGVTARRVTLPEGADFAQILPLLPQSGDVELNVWYTQRADYRGMMNCVLSHGTPRMPETFTTYGMSSLRYRDPSLSVPERVPFAANFGVARVESVGDIPDFPPDHALCLPLEITLAQPVSDDLKAAVIARNALGWEIARADAIFAQADQRTTSQLAPGERLTAYPLLRLPYGAPPGVYGLFLRVYDEATLSGYEVTRQDSTRGREIHIGIWDASDGADWQATGRASSLPVPTELVVTESLRLTAYGLDPHQRAANGQTLRLSLLWEGMGMLPDLTLSDSSGRWEMGIPAPEGEMSGVVLDWREVRIPPEAEAGQAELRLPEGTLITHIELESIPGLYTVPEFQREAGVEVPGVGLLVGYTLDDPVTLDQPASLTLVWQGGETPAAVDYTVFAQLVDSDGNLIAQSDSIPAAGQRPVTGWRAGEYIVDTHTLRFNDAAHSGAARLIVGMYDPLTGQRVRLADGTDFIELATVEVR